MAPKGVPQCLRAFDGETHTGAATAAAAFNTARSIAVVAANVTNRVPARPNNMHQVFTSTCTGDELTRGTTSKFMVRGTLPSRSADSLQVRACQACFTLHQAEALLMKAERRLGFATAVVSGKARGCCIRKVGTRGKGLGHSDEAIADRSRCQPHKGLGKSEKVRIALKRGQPRTAGARDHSSGSGVRTREHGNIDDSIPSIPQKGQQCEHAIVRHDVLLGNQYMPPLFPRVTPLRL